LVIVGSFDLCYYYYIELHFEEVAHINCPVWFDCPEFSDEGQITNAGSSIEKPRRFAIRTPDGRHTVIARSLKAVLGMVYHYDRGAQFQPGERIAETPP
jgi:hypothetical protein